MLSVEARNKMNSVLSFSAFDEGAINESIKIALDRVAA